MLTKDGKPVCEWCNGGNDVAILTLATKVTYSDRIRPICLPSGGNETTSASYENEIALAAGFGVHELNETWNVPVKNDDTSCFGQKCPNLNATEFSDTQGESPSLFKTEMEVMPTWRCAIRWQKVRIYLSDWGMGNSINEKLWISKYIKTVKFSLVGVSTYLVTRHQSYPISNMR